MSAARASERRYRIAEVGRMTGFAPTALRFYERAGVLAPPERTAAGYRLYGERDVERLRLVARAKALGCSLEEIAELVRAWNADECVPVKHRLRTLVNEKLADVQRHVAEQVAFAAQLQATAADLDDRPVDGPCDDRCGCTTAQVGPADEARPEACGCSTDGTVAAPLPLVVRTDGDDRTAIACSLGAAGTAARMEEWQAVLAHVVARQPVAGGLRLTLGRSTPLPEIVRLAAAEHDCCSFFAFAVTVDDRGLALEVTAPAGGQAVLESLFGMAAPAT